MAQRSNKMEGKRVSQKASRTDWLFRNERKLETYAEMVGMTIYRDQYDRIEDILYEDYSYEDSLDHDRLPDRTKDRYYLEYWMVCGGPYRHRPCKDDALWLQDENLRKGCDPAEIRAFEQAVAAKKEKEEARRKLEAILEVELAKRRRERSKIKEAEQRKATQKRHAELRRKEAWKREQEKAASLNRILANIENRFAKRQAWNDLNKSKREHERLQCETEKRCQIDEEYQKTLARRKRQKAAIESGQEYSTPTHLIGQVVTWSSQRITDIKIVRLVLDYPPPGVTYPHTREMTEAEVADYWYWKARRY